MQDWRFILLSIAFVAAMCGSTVMWCTTLYKEQIFKTLTLINGTKLYNAWKNPPLEPLLCVHLFNYTNIDEYFSLDNKGHKNITLKTQDVGPYCFREKIERQHIEFANNGAEMNYREKRDHTFDAQASMGFLNDTVYVPNILILSIYSKIDESEPFVRYVAHRTLQSSGANPFIKVLVGDFLYGYEDQVFSMVGSVINMVNGDERKIPKKFGVLQKRIGLSNDVVVIRTGDDNMDEMGQVIKINNATQFNAWGSSSCNHVQGSDGLFFRRSAIQSFADIDLFHKDSCRSLPLEFDEILQLKGGITAHRYKLKRNIFNSDLNENKCYYNSTNLLRYGILRISKCSAVSGAPIAISRPHLLYSNANLDSNNMPIIEGLQPDIKKHDFTIDVFPIIGLTVRTLMRMQLNVIVSNIDNDENLSPMVDNTVLPMVWVEMNSGTEVPEKMHSLLYHLSYTMKWVEQALKWIFLLATLLIAYVLFKISFFKGPKKEVPMVIAKKTITSNNVVTNVYIPINV